LFACESTPTVADVLAPLEIGTKPANKPASEKPSLAVTVTTEAEPSSEWSPKLPPGDNVSSPDYPQHQLTPDTCGDLDDGGPIKDGCITKEIHCGDTILGHTRGGAKKFDTEFYAKKFCWPATVDHDGGNERIYRLIMPSGENRAWVTLYTPCADLDLAAMRFSGESCPTIAQSVRSCEMKVQKGNMTERVELTTQTKAGNEPVWYVVVEGKNEEEGAFELHVQCRPGLGGPVDP